MRVCMSLWAVQVGMAMSCGVSPTVAACVHSSVKPYNAYGACVTEVEVDVTTGEVSLSLLPYRSGLHEA